MHHAGRALLLLEERQETTVHAQVITKLRALFRRDPVGVDQVNRLREWHDWRIRTDYNPNLASDLQAEAQEAPVIAQGFFNFIRTQLQNRGVT
jgi:uncharacterized protein (UPF0332 family)